MEILITILLLLCAVSVFLTLRSIGPERWRKKEKASQLESWQVPEPLGPTGKFFMWGCFWIVLAAMAFGLLVIIFWIVKRAWALA